MTKSLLLIFLKLKGYSHMWDTYVSFHMCGDAIYANLSLYWSNDYQRSWVLAAEGTQLHFSSKKIRFEKFRIMMAESWDWW